jgi:short-subunit dehydrogenase
VQRLDGSSATSSLREAAGPLTLPPMSLPSPGPDRAAVVTGASSGIGIEIARQLVSRGHQVILVARSADKLAAVAKELGEGAHVLPTDLADRAARAGLLERIGELGLTPDVLVNNAGLSTLGPVTKSDPEAELNMLEVDVLAVADLCSRFLPGMVSRGRGAVLNVASTAAFQPLPGQAGYGAGKAFVLSYTQSLAGELRGTGVSATALCPGPVKTGFGETAGFAEEDAETALPKIMWVSAEAVAKAAVDGLARGRLVVIPGAANRVGAVFAQLAPRSLLLPMLAKNHPGLK